jgi:hypothetical protein
MLLGREKSCPEGMNENRPLLAIGGRPAWQPLMPWLVCTNARRAHAHSSPARFDKTLLALLMVVILMSVPYALAFPA